MKHASTAQGRHGQPVPPPPTQTYALIYETPSGIRLVEVVASMPDEAWRRGVIQHAIDETLVTRACVITLDQLFRTSVGVLLRRPMKVANG
jgi:hypothetical protein